MALNRVSIPSPNYSSRGGAPVTTIVLHTAEGARTYRELGNFFANPSSGVSSHVGIDDTPGLVGEYVPRSGKAWTAANANPWCVQAELCAFASWSAAEWDAHPLMLQNTAAWIAEEAGAFNIPLNRLGSSGAQNPGVRGVCQHSDLGAMGGGHWDCGPAFPLDRVLEMAAGGSPPAQRKRDMGPAVCIAQDGVPWYFTIGGDGQIWANAGGDSGNFWSIGGGGEVDPDSGPDAATQPDGRIIVTARGKAGDVRVTSRDPGDGKWSPWWSMGGK